MNIKIVPVTRQNQTHHIPDQLKASQSMLSTEVGEEWVGPAGSGKWLVPQCAKRPPSLLSLSVESDILRKYFHVSFHAATDEGTPQKISPQDTPTNGLTCQCNQTSLHHNLYRFAFLSEPCYVSIGNCKLLSGRGSLFRQWGQREVYNLHYVTEWYVPKKGPS